MIPQFASQRRFDANLARDGGRQILWGLWKKLFIADNLAVFVNYVYAAPESFTGWQMWLATLAFTFQIYADFSAYSDIAIGLGKLLGFRLMQNFDYPYFSKSLSEFWRRWHISLSSWFRDYVYIPLGGNRVSPGRRAFNVMVTFVVSGIWHGASWNFAIWGLIHGLGVVPSALDLRRRVLPEAPGLGRRVRAALAGVGQRVLPSDTTLTKRFIQASILGPSLRLLSKMSLTFFLVVLGWVFFRAATLEDAGHILSHMISAPLTDDLGSILPLLRRYSFSSLSLLGVVLMLVIEWKGRSQEHPLALLPSRISRPGRWIVYLMLLFTSIIFMGRSDAFIYFQF